MEDPTKSSIGRKLIRLIHKLEKHEQTSINKAIDAEQHTIMDMLETWKKQISENKIYQNLIHDTSKKCR